MPCFNSFIHRGLLMALMAGLLCACGGGGNSDSAGTGGNGGSTTPIAANNTMPVVVDSGVGGNAVNQLFASVTLCQPGSTNQCRTVDHLLVDTGSTGLRVFSAAMAGALNLPHLSGPSGLPLVNCVQFIDNTYAWGPVVKADLVLGGKSAAGVPIQVIADPAFNTSNKQCSSGGQATAINTAAALGANGILGLGFSQQDCGAACTSNPNNGSYFSCTSSTCAATVASTASISSQVTHPVPLFATDNNGVLIELPTVAAAGARQVNGMLTFGIGTQTNNQLNTASVLSTDAHGYITTRLAGLSLTTSFIDSGSNGLYFDSASLPVCALTGNASGFYCPAVPANLSATLLGANGQVAAVNFSVANALTSFATLSTTAIPTLSGPIGDAQTFDWGLPFFYGRRVFIGIHGQASSQGTAPYYAF